MVIFFRRKKRERDKSIKLESFDDLLDVLNKLEQEAQEAREMAEKVFKMVPMFLGEKVMRWKNGFRK